MSPTASKTNMVLVNGYGPHVRIKGTGTVKVLTDKSIVNVSLKETTDITFSGHRTHESAAASAVPVAA